MFIALASLVLLTHSMRSLLSWELLTTQLQSKVRNPDNISTYDAKIASTIFFDLQKHDSTQRQRGHLATACERTI